MGRKKSAFEINWKATPEEFKAIDRIVDRAVKLSKKSGVDYDRQDCEMDITACHLNAQRLRLKDLLVADDFNFKHDVFGIRRFLDRDTAQLTRHFLPRFAEKEKEEEERKAALEVGVEAK